MSVDRQITLLHLLLGLADEFSLSRETTDLPTGSGRGTDSSNPVIDVNHDACILCDRCVRACDDIQGNDVIGRSGKGYDTHIAFDLSDPMGASSCVSCGECMVSCPTGALTNKRVVGTQLGEGEVLDPAELLDLPIFQNVSGTFLELNQKAVVKRHYRAGEIICREGDFGSTAFYILEGRIELYLTTQLSHIESKRRRSADARRNTSSSRRCWRRPCSRRAGAGWPGRRWRCVPRR